VSGAAVAAVAGDFTPAETGAETGDASGPRTRAARTALLRVEEAALELAAGAWDVAERVAGGVLAGRPGGAVLLAAHGTLALARAAAGDAVGRDRAARAAAAAADAVSDAELADHVDAVTRAGWACLAAGDDAAAGRLFGRAAGLATATAQDAELPAAALGAACVAVRSGRLDDAVRRALVCEAAGGRLTGAARAVHAWALLLRDGGAAAAVPVERLLRDAGPGTPLGAVAASLAAAVALTEGADGTGGTAAARCADGPAEAHGSVLAAVRAATALAVGMPSPPPARDEVLLGAALGASDPETAVDLLRRAAEAFRAAGLTATACWLRLLLARRLLACGRLREAQTAVGVLKADANRCATGGYLQRSAADLQRVLGSRAPRTGADDRTLSPREREIAGLVCRGLTNADIAGLLFISARTVEAHLTHIFRKAGVRSRTALAGAMASGATPAVLS
jgi:DNA-binding NarL/FixJ family response regulator